MRKWLNIILVLSLVVLLGATIIESWNYTEYGVSILFSGLNLKPCPTNLGPGEATDCVDWVFDKAGALHVRKGLDQWNLNTHEDPFEYLASYVDPTNQGWYVIKGMDTLWIAQDDETDWTDRIFEGEQFSSGTVDYYDGDDVVHGNDLYQWRSVFGAGDGMEFYLDDSSDAFTIEAIWDDSLLRLDRSFSGDGTTEGYYIQVSYGEVNDVAEANGLLFLATDNGLYYFDGDSIQKANSTVITRYKYDIDSVEYEVCDGAWDRPRLKWFFGTWRGSGTEPAWGDGTAAGVWALNNHMYVTYKCFAKDTTTQHPQLKQFYTMQYKITDIDPGNLARTNGSLMFYNDSSLSRVSIYETEIDSSSIIEFLVDSVHVDSVNVPGIGYNIYNTFTAVDSVWDSLRFETGDWYLWHPDQTDAIRKKLVWDHTGQEWPIVGLNDSSGFFYVCGGPLILNDSDTTTVKAFRKKKKTTGATDVDYRLLEVYKDRLWTVTARNPDELKYSLVFEPEDVASYQTIGVDIVNGDEIVVLKEMHGQLYIFSKLTIHTLSGATVDDFYLRKVVPNVGVVARHAFVDCGQFVLVPHTSGFYVYDGGQLVKISDKIEPIVKDSINWRAAEDAMCAEFYDNHIWISYPSGVSEDNNRTLVYSLRDGRWGNASFVATAYHKIDNPADTNEFLISAIDSGSVFVYKGFTDGAAELEPYYRTGWQDFGSRFVKEIKDYYTTYNKSANCSLIVEFARSDTVLYADTIGANAGAQTFHEKRRVLEALQKDISGRYIRLKLELASSAADGWISRLHLGVAHKYRKAHDE